MTISPKQTAALNTLRNGPANIPSRLFALLREGGLAAATGQKSGTRGYTHARITERGEGAIAG